MGLDMTEGLCLGSYFLIQDQLTWFEKVGFCAFAEMLQGILPGWNLLLHVEVNKFLFLSGDSKVLETFKGNAKAALTNDC